MAPKPIHAKHIAMKTTQRNSNSEQGSPRPEQSKTQPQNPFSYFFSDNQRVLDELARLGIRFCACDVGGDIWPALVLPSGKVLSIASDPEGNGPGAIHIFDQE